jgi:hypothetical protein
MGGNCTWRRFRGLLEIERDRQMIQEDSRLVEIGLKAKK